jgi:hypothetical protein
MRSLLPSRRRTLGALAVVLLVLTHAAVLAQSDSLTPQTVLPPHPRLLLLGGEEGPLRQAVTADAHWRGLHESILAECEALLAEPTLQRIQIGRRLLSVSRECLRRVFFLGYAHRLTGQERYLRRAEQELLAVAAFSDWNPSHFLDVAEMTLGVALGYDWLYAGLSAETRATLRQAMLEKGLRPSLDKRYNSWLTATHNWNQVCNTGMLYGALALYEDQPDLARTLINRSLRTIGRSMGDYAPDGAYPEGYGYWGYGTSFNVLFISALEKALGRDFGLAAQPGFLKTAGYLQHMTGPTGLPFNYSDAGNTGGLQPAMCWFAARQNDPSLLWVERSRLRETTEKKQDRRNRLLPAALIWGHRIRLDELPVPRQTVWSGGGKNPVALLRTSWTDPAAAFVGLKAGSPSVNHAHMDVGSFVYEVDGVRWAVDLGMQEYESLESKGVKLWGKEQDAQRWDVFRYNNLAHNTLTVNGEFQRVEGFAPLTGVSADPAFRSATTDLAALYPGSLSAARRGVALDAAGRLLVRDELRAGTAPATVRWTMVTPATVRLLAPNQAELIQDGKKVLVTVESPARVQFQTRPADPTHDYDAPNPGITLLSFDVQVPAGTPQALNVRLQPEKTAGQRPQPAQPLDRWPK